MSFFILRTYELKKYVNGDYIYISADVGVYFFDMCCHWCISYLAKLSVQKSQVFRILSVCLRVGCFVQDWVTFLIS